MAGKMVKNNTGSFCVFILAEVNIQEEDKEFITRRSVPKRSREKRYHCTSCEYKSPYSGRLKCHMCIIHSNEKPYICNLCKYRTANLWVYQLPKNHRLLCIRWYGRRRAFFLY
ncbi:unnamed protein product [Nezara viridula]|uniref:C2H2-type domain-containing protein n=1 Tax=Nezara viridula TaxID=85310 RepID=A0A9P0HFP6_NEZVI|nr:unnamed protein product [Nezara viridula]